MDSNSNSYTPQLPPRRRSMGSSSTPPQLPPNFNMQQQQQPEPQSRPSTPPQLIPPNFNINFQLERHPWTSLSRILREDGTIQLPPNFNLKDVESMQRPPLGLKFELTPEILADYRNGKREREEAAKAKAVELQPPIMNKAGNKASTIRATSISIGPNWRKESIREDHLTLKIYFNKKKLIWEFLEGPLKEKIEVSWSDITAIHAHMPRHQPGLLKIQLGNKPLFFREITPQPGKHTIWEKADDFTVVGDALYHRIHAAEFGHGVLNEHYTKLLQTDQRLLQLSRKYCNPFPYPYPYPYPYPTQGESAPYSSPTAACMPSTSHQQQSLSLSVNNPSPISTAASHSHLNPIPIPFTVGVGESSFHMQGESSRYANYYHETPLLALGDEDSDTAQIGGHHNSFVYEASSFLESSQLLQGMSYNQPLLHQELNQFQNNPTHINNIVPANTYTNNLYGVTHVHQPTMEMENTTAAHHHQHNNNTAAMATSAGGVTAAQQSPQLDDNGNNNLGNSMDLYDLLYRFHTGP